MENSYKSALDKMKLSEAEKEKAKSLFYGLEERKESHMRGKRLFRSAAVAAAALAVVLGGNAVIPALQDGSEVTPIEKLVDNYFVATAYAKELTKGGKIYSDKYSSVSSAWCGTEDGEMSFAFDFPVRCEGKNIATVTYKIEEGAFQIYYPKKNIVVDGEKVKKSLNTPGHAGEVGQYKSFTVNYEDQFNEKFCIEVVDTSDIWSEEKQRQYDTFGGSYWGGSYKVKKEICNFLTENLGITCTVTYQDGTTETKNILVSNEIMKESELFSDDPEAIKEGGDGKYLVRCFSLQ